MKNLKSNKNVLLKLLTIFTVFCLATITTPTDSVFAQDIAELEEKEVEREEDFLQQLLLDIPETTDNPSHIITFVDPSDDKSGVELEIDEGGFEQISSPYTLPALSIGQHELRFKFVDKYGSTQTLEKGLIVIPRPPIMNSPFFEEGLLKLSGTGLSNSDLVLILSSGKNISVEETTIDAQGNWKISINEEELSEGVYTFSAFTRRNGYASNLSEPLTFEVGESNNVSFNNDNEIYFSFKEISWENLGDIITKNIDLGLLVGGAFILGFVICLLITSLVKGSIDNKTIKNFEKKMKQNGMGKKDVTLKEKLSQKAETEEGKKEVKEEKKKTKKAKKEKNGEKQNKTEKILTKVDFLKDYKKFDPDDKEGKEKDNIEVKVTSKS
ncbi:MAG: transmembrane(s)protein [candidate division WS6 bacterium 36_33]|uniref:Transmembrane(S)protein n=1 Tax=candidate division WS6 bacterium 36_33 TaxID=1641388 RepID=A0A117LTV0_9BACT|nr:MAG: transmembrane(s)protein [candidate division WS6 bacterium 36_33]